MREKIDGVFENDFVTAQIFWTRFAVSNPFCITDFTHLKCLWYKSNVVSKAINKDTFHNIFAFKMHSSL